MQKVLLGMSGGVDSTVSALLLKRGGYDVCGITLIMHPSQEGSAASARLAAEQIGIEHVTVDVQNEFDKLVIRPFANLYLSGSTPNPCVLCNAGVKFPALLYYASKHGFDHIATGHYADITQVGGVYYISAPTDKVKDQTYFLYSLGQDMLKRLILPLSGLDKARVRAIAAEAGLSAAGERDSQDVCFIPDGDHAAFIESYSHVVSIPGNFTDMAGKTLGKHLGVSHYTVGQRRGLGIPAESRLYVTRIDRESNTVILGDDADLYRTHITVLDCLFAAGNPPAISFRADVRIRYTKRQAPATVTASPDNEKRFDVVFDEPQRAPARGQAAVFFSDDILLGGGTIA